MPPVHEDDELDGPRATKVNERIERRANCATGVQDVVDQQNPAVVDRELDLGLP